MRAGAAAEVEELAERSGALLATTLLARGMFDHNPFSIGVAGGFARDIARELGGEADLVVAIGTSLNYYTVDGGNMFPKATVVQIDTEPLGLHNGLKAGDLHLLADAKLAVAATLETLRARGKTIASIRSGELARRIRDEPADSAQFPIEPGLLDPRAAIAELDRVIPKDYDSVSGSGHQSYFHSTMRGRRPENYHAVREFGAIGNGISLAIGVAAAKKNGKVVLFEGDGSLLMHIQELETIRRQGIRMLISVMNDGGYGAEFHKFRANGIDPAEAMHGRGDLAGVATGFGLRSAAVTEMGRFAPLFREHQAANIGTLWDIHTDDLIPSRAYRRVHYGEA